MKRGVAPKSSVMLCSFVGTDLNQKSDNFKVPILSCYEKRRCSIVYRALVFVGTRLNQKSNNFKVPILRCYGKKALLCYLSCLGQSWHLTQPTIGQLQGAHSEMLWKKGVAPLSIVLWSLLAPDSTRNRTTSRCPFSAAMKRGVALLFVLPWSILAPDSTNNRTTSRRPF